MNSNYVQNDPLAVTEPRCPLPRDDTISSKSKVNYLFALRSTNKKDSKRYAYSEFRKFGAIK